jgi:hypothetical protein
MRTTIEDLQLLPCRRLVSGCNTPCNQNTCFGRCDNLLTIASQRLPPKCPRMATPFWLLQRQWGASDFCAADLEPFLRMLEGHELATCTMVGG